LLLTLLTNLSKCNVNVNVNLYSASSQKNDASNALNVPSIVTKETSSVYDENSQFACPAHAYCFGTSLCRWSSDSEGATAVRIELK